MSMLTRRAVLARSIAAATTLATAPVLRSFAAPTDDFWRLDATAQADLVRRGEASALELVNAAIARIEHIDPHLNAVVLELFERARARARRPGDGPFAGVPFLIKDLDDLTGTRTSMGSRLFEDYVATGNGPYVDAALATGVIPLGKSNTPEFGLIGTTESLALGACRNPWNTDHTPGGSSGGAGAAVAAGLVPFAHATDGGGSIRIPASCNGLFGLKPSRGRPGMAPPGGAEITVQFCVSRSVRDSANLFAATERAGGPHAPVGVVRGPSDRRLRIAFSTRSDTGAAPHAEVEAAAQRAAALCAELGHEVVEAAPSVDGPAFVDSFLTVWSALAANVLAMARTRELDPEAVLEPWTLGLAAHHARLPADAGERAIAHFAALRDAYEAFHDRYDVVLTPTLAAPPVRIGDQAPTVPWPELEQRVFDWVAYTPIHNATGSPAMSVPLGASADGLPIGIQFGARPGAERTLLELAFELEAAAPWAERWPALATA